MTHLAAISSINLSPPPRPLHSHSLSSRKRIRDAHAPPPPSDVSVAIAPPWPFFFKIATMDTMLRFQHPCGICRPTPVGVCTIAHSQENCSCGALAWCCCNCDRHFCVVCFQNTDDKFLSSFKISEADWHPYTLRNIPLRVSAHNPDYFPGAVNLDPLEPQTPFSFSLYAPEEATYITIQLSMPWPSLRIDRDGISILPPSVWPRATHGAPDINAVWHPGQAARAAREYSLVVALQNAQCTQENARLHSEESRRLEMEGDCGVELNPLRNCRPQDAALYAHRLAHRPPSHLPRPSLSVFRKEASELAGVLPPVASWPLYVVASAFTWPCGECRVQRDACFRKPAIGATDALCACFELATILCVECNTHLCYACFINMDEYFLHSFKLTRTTKELFQFRNLPIPSPRLLAQAQPPPSDSEDDGDECATEPPSQSSYQELLIESRRGPAAEACKLLFAPPSAIVMANGYAMNDFVAADSDIESSFPTQTGSDASWVDSCPNLCEECGQPLPSSQVQRPRAFTALPPAQLALTEPATAACLPPSAFSLAAQAILVKATPAPLAAAAQTPQQRVFVFAPPQALPLLPPLTRIMASVAAATGNPTQPPTVTPPDAPLVGIHHNPGPQDPTLSLFVIAAPPAARIAGILTHPGPLDLPPTRLRTAVEPQCVYCPPAAPLVGLEKNPGPVQQAKSTFPAPQRNSSSRVVFDSPEDHPVAPAAGRATPLRRRSSQLPPVLPQLAPDSDSSDGEDVAPPLATHTHGTRSAVRLQRHISQPAASPPAVQPAIHDDHVFPAAATLHLDSEDDSPAALAQREDFRAHYAAVHPAPLSPSSQLRPQASQNAHTRHFPFDQLPNEAIPSDRQTALAAYNFDCCCSIDGGCAKKRGSYAFVAYFANSCHLEATKIDSPTTNNVAEFKALLAALKKAHRQKLRRILLVTDSLLVANFVKGTARIKHAHLASILLEIKQLFPAFESVHVSHVRSHANVSTENAIADLLCTWAIRADASVAFTGAFSPRVDTQEPLTELLTLLTHAALHAANPHPENADLAVPLPASNALAGRHTRCTHCLGDHNADSCPLVQFLNRDADTTGPCRACCSPLHASTVCPLLADASRRPVRSSFTPGPVPLLLEREQQQARMLFTADVPAITFPRKCNRQQFIDYYITIFLGFLQATENSHVQTTVDAAQAWTSHFHFDNHCIKRTDTRRADRRDSGTNQNPPPLDAQDEMARRALRAARLIPKARVSAVSKALRSSDPVPLTPDIIEKLRECYPVATPDEATVFPPKALGSYVANRDALARVIMARDTTTHPGFAGITFDVLQHFCIWTYKLEEPDHPDYRWDILCRLISKIMSGNALILSDFLLDVVGAFFDKNAEKKDAPFALRNLGIEESLLRVAATLVFEEVLPAAFQGDFLTIFDLGAGTKSGAEIFGRIGATLSHGGAPIAIFDVMKAFNNLRRADIKEAVAAFNNPLLSAFVHFLFSKDSKVSFRCPVSDATFTTYLTKGIHQGNPLSVFIFCLTIAFILKPFRDSHPEALVATYVDDFQLSSKADAIARYPELLSEFIRLFYRHGLRFDLSESAKSSVYTVAPLPEPIRDAIMTVGMICQNEGIAPCKIACGTPSFLDKHASKLAFKLTNRYAAFQALWPAMLRLDRRLKRPTHHNAEHFLNLVRLSFLSMPTYVLRTLNPSHCASYRTSSTNWAIALIQNVLPPFVDLPASQPANNTVYPDLKHISQRIMQLPLTLGGWSLRLPETIGDIAYSSSSVDCMPMLRLAARHLDIDCDQSLVPELRATQQRILSLLPCATVDFWNRAEDPLDEQFKNMPLQHFVTTLFNAAEKLAIAETLKPWPIYFHAFAARIHKSQEHTSWPINPRTRAHFSLGMLSDAEFSRTLAISIFHPIMAPRVCPCKGFIDPAGFHLLHCTHIHYGIMHDRVKESVAARLRSFTTIEAANLSVQVEQPMDQFFLRRDPMAVLSAIPLMDSALIADMVVSLHGDLQQTPIACDFVSCISRGPTETSDFNSALKVKAAMKVSKYARYDLPQGSFFALPFGRTNVLSKEILEFCTLVHSHFPPLSGVDRKLRATFSRAIYAGVAQSFNLGVRRLQLASTWRVPVPAIPLPVLMNPLVRGDPVAAAPHSKRSFLTAAAGWQPYLPHASPALSTLVGAVLASRRAAIFAQGVPRADGGPVSVNLGDSAPTDDSALRACDD
jgi:ribonuclease HI